jgi:glycosyltransferase involved in cell wall biosynthesis
MSPSAVDDLLRTLADRGSISPEPAPRPLPPGNRDRRPELARHSWRVCVRDGREAKLTIGSALGPLALRCAALAEACPDITAAPLFHEQLPHGEVLAEVFFDGITLDAAVRDGRPSPDIVRNAFAQVCMALAATQQSSTEPARDAEWQNWADGVCELPVWTESERDLLRRLVLPPLHGRLTAGPPVTRWTNGDFLGSNVLVAADGRVCLVDAEFAAQTHFFAEDAIRFQVLSEAARQQPALFSAVQPDPGLAWHLFFWLRQLQLEVAQNTADYLSRTLPTRRATIRRLAEHLFSIPLSGWSTAATEVSYRLEQARWVAARDYPLVLVGWCHVPSAQALRSVVALIDGRRLAEANLSPRPDVQAHFGGDEHALHAGFVLQIPPVDPSTLLTLAVIANDGTLIPFHAIHPADLPGPGPLIVDYPAWAAQFDPDPRGPEPGKPAAGVSPRASPGALKFSILLPVFNTPEGLLRDCIESVRRQQHPHWELCIVDDASTAPHVRPLLEAFAAQDARVHLHFRTENGGIARSTNDALARAADEYVVMLDHDDRLRPHALTELARWIAAGPDADVLYSDEEKISIEGERVWPFLKPAFSPEFLLGVMYPGHVLCVRTTVARAAGGFDPAFSGVQDYEFFLRLTERTRRIVHVPRILYQWRLALTSSALSGNIKGDMNRLQVDAVRAHLARTHQRRRIVPLGGHRVLLSADSAVAAPTVSVIIAADAGLLPEAGILRQRMETGGARITEVLADAPSVERLRRLASTATGDILVFLAFIPSDLPPGWLTELAALAMLDDSGAVAPILLAPDGKVLEAGWIAGLNVVAPLMRGFSADNEGYNGALRCNRETSAVSGLCLAIRRDRYAEAGGIQPEFGAPLWAVDLCLRLEAAGRYNRVAAAVRIATPFSWDQAEDLAAYWPAFSRRWQYRLSQPDRFFNPHFDLAAGDYRLAARSTDLVQPGAPSNAPLQVYIDAPANFILASRFLRLRGWCFVPGAKLQGVRLKLPAMEIFGLYGTHRPDVRAALPEAPDDHTGFELWTEVPRGRYQAVLQFQAEGGVWRDATFLELQVPRLTWPAWLPGGNTADLVAFQLGLCPAHAPRAITPEHFPAPRTPVHLRPRLSIVTPSFNQARFVEQTITSVLNQEVSPDYVVQDGGSTDDSVEILHRHAARLHAWESAPDQGQADAIARGFAKTTGRPEDLMAWLNSDDFYLPGALRFVADWFAQHPEVDVTYGHRVVVDEQGREINRWFLPRHDPAFLRLNDFVPQETLFWRRRIWDRVAGVDPSLQFAIDWDLLLRFQEVGAVIVHVPYFLACFRVHQAQKTSAQIKSTGQQEIDLLRTRTQGRLITQRELENDPRLIRYLRKSAQLELLWKLGIRK